MRPDMTMLPANTSSPFTTVVLMSEPCNSNSSISTPRKSISLIPEPKEIFPTFFNLAGIFTLPVAVRLRVPPILSSEANCSGLNPAMEILALPSIAIEQQKSFSGHIQVLAGQQFAEVQTNG